MKLKPVIKVKPVEQKPAKKTQKSAPSWGSDEYKPMFEPKRLLVRETISSKDGKPIKQYLEVSVKRFGEDGLPFVFLSMYQESEFYTGYLKGKTTYFPLEVFTDVLDILADVDEECDKRKIE